MRSSIARAERTSNKGRTKQLAPSPQPLAPATPSLARYLFVYMPPASQSYKNEKLITVTTLPHPWLPYNTFPHPPRLTPPYHPPSLSLLLRDPIPSHQKICRSPQLHIATHIPNPCPRLHPAAPPSPPTACRCPTQHARGARNTNSTQGTAHVRHWERPVGAHSSEHTAPSNRRLPSVGLELKDQVWRHKSVDPRSGPIICSLRNP